MPHGRGEGKGGPPPGSRPGAVHARGRSVPERRPCGPDPDLPSVRLRSIAHRDGRTGGGLPPLVRAPARLGSDRSAEGGRGAGGDGCRDRGTLRRHTATRRAARAERRHQPRDRILDRPRSNPPPRRAEHGAAGRRLDVPDRAVRRGSRGLVRRRRLRPGGPLAAPAWRAIGAIVPVRGAGPRPASGHRGHEREHAGEAGARERIAGKDEEVRGHGDAFYWDSPASPARDQLERELESSSYVITYVATPAATHLPTVALYYDLSDVILIEKPLGAPPEAYREFLDAAPGGVEIVAADHYYFKLEVRLLQLLLTEERTLRDFLDSVDEIRIEILEEQPLTGAAADIGVIADLIPHAFAIISLLTPIDHIQLDPQSPLLVGRHEGLQGQRESYARMNGSFPYHGRTVRLVIDAGKGAENAKWIKLSGEPRAGGRRPSSKIDFGRGEAIDGTQATVRAAVRRIREPGVPDNAHLNMLRHVIEKRHPAVGILSIREAIRANQRVRDLEAMAVDLLARGQWTGYSVRSRPAFDAAAQTSPLQARTS